MNKTSLRGREGFTLVELLTVVSILGILVAIALPAYLNASKTARCNAADGDARALASAVQANALRAGVYPSSLTDVALASDMGGAIPNNPCSASAAASGYTYTSGANGVSIAAKNDACVGYAPTTFALSL